ncbi:MAG: hypothetical protein JWQ36_3054 [Enterovirga sp.]|jgi:hypothetical protein|nr:hypothetical protein [Enterovirga sp.]
MAERESGEGKRFDEVDSAGTNARPRHDTIAQTGGGVPDDTGRPVDLDEEGEARIAESILKMPGGKGA